MVIPPEWGTGRLVGGPLPEGVMQFPGRGGPWTLLSFNGAVSRFDPHTRLAGRNLTPTGQGRL